MCFVSYFMVPLVDLWSVGLAFFWSNSIVFLKVVFLFLFHIIKFDPSLVDYAFCVIADMCSLWHINVK